MENLCYSAFKFCTSNDSWKNSGLGEADLDSVSWSDDAVLTKRDSGVAHYVSRQLKLSSCDYYGFHSGVVPISYERFGRGRFKKVRSRHLLRGRDALHRQD